MQISYDSESANKRIYVPLHGVQIIEAETNGALFISTMFNSKALITESKKLDMPILCGVSSLDEARQAMVWGAEALKIYPATAVKPDALEAMIYELKNDGTLIMNNVTDIIVAGGVSQEDFGAYLAAGATNFAIGFDCEKITPRQIGLRIKELTKAFNSVKK